MAPALAAGVGGPFEPEGRLGREERSGCCLAGKNAGSGCTAWIKVSARGSVELPLGRPGTCCLPLAESRKVSVSTDLAIVRWPPGGGSLLPLSRASAAAPSLGSGLRRSQPLPGRRARKARAARAAAGGRHLRSCRHARKTGLERSKLALKPQALQLRALQTVSSCQVATKQVCSGSNSPAAPNTAPTMAPMGTEDDETSAGGAGPGDAAEAPATEPSAGGAAEGPAGDAGD